MTWHNFKMAFLKPRIPENYRNNNISAVKYKITITILHRYCNDIYVMTKYVICKSITEIVLKYSFVYLYLSMSGS